MWLLDWRVCRPDLSPIENVILKCYEVQNITMQTLKCVAHHARLGKNSINEASNISVLSSQMPIECC